MRLLALFRIGFLDPYPVTITLTHYVRQMRGSGNTHMFAGSDGDFYIIRLGVGVSHARQMLDAAVTAQFMAELGITHTPLRRIEFSGAVADHLRSSGIGPGVSLGTLYLGSQVPGKPALQSVYDYMPARLLEAVDNVKDFWGALCVDAWLNNHRRRHALFARSSLHKPFPGMLGRYTAFMTTRGSGARRDTWLQDSCIYSQRAVYRDVTGLESFERWIRTIRDLPRPSEWLPRVLPEEWLAALGDEARERLHELDRSQGQIERLLVGVRSASPDAFPNWH